MRVKGSLQSCRLVVGGLHSCGQILHQPPLQPGPHIPVIPNGVTIPRHSHQCDEYCLIALTAPVRVSHTPMIVNITTPS